MTENLVAGLVGALMGVVINWTAHRSTGHRRGQPALERFFDRLVDEQSVLDELARDPFMGRDYARPELASQVDRSRTPA